MLRYVTMNIFDSPAQTLVNAVNTVGVMGKGIAQEYKQRYPEMFRKYRQFCLNGSLTIGKLYLYKSPNKWVLNLPTKKHWRNPSKLEYVEASLKKFVETYAESGITSISFPQLGTGNGALDWEVVRPLMFRYLSPLPIQVFIHVARTSTDFVPEHLDKEEVRALRAPRQALTFPEFLRDLYEHADGVTSPAASDYLEDTPLPELRFEDFTIPGKELEILWEELRLRGAVSVGDYPPTIAAHALEVTDRLLRLGYIRPIRFAPTGEATTEGIRFAPREDNGTAHERPGRFVAQAAMFPEVEPTTH